MKNSRPLRKQVLQSWQLYILLLPAATYVALFKIYPMYGLQMAFKDYRALNGIWGSEWAGIKHFERFFASYDFWRVLGNTIELSLYDLIVSFPFPILLALMLNQVRAKLFKQSVQLVTYAPHFISVVVLVGMVVQFLDPRLGLINGLIEFFGYPQINWMAKPEYFKTIYVLSGIWQNTGFACIIYLAALSGINPTLHEAALMDGSSRIRRIWHIDLPGIMPVIMIILILNAGHILNVGYEKVLLMQNPLNLEASEVIDTYVYKIGLNSPLTNYSYATAIGLFKSVAGLIMLIIVNYAAKKAKQATLW
ncbi:sugar ABC transporter permease [Paenibacillus sp. IB182493]|uniref:Sugar ABC transporter permease n=2 Tax=Paenibacillus arenilitoris TaxID=2772299 RepID=A0A927H6V4_9BACL|nr:sugar ABC transporter permease [Paenibacillus arenilitoris]